MIKLLYVEFEKDVREVTVSGLKALLGDEVTITVTTNAMEAIALSSWRPGVVLSDWHMACPHEGALVAEHYSKLPEPVPVIIASGGAFEAEAMRAGASRYIEKPYRIEDVAAAIKELAA